MKSYSAKLNRLQCIVTLLLVFAITISCFVVLSSTDNNAFAYTSSNIGSATPIKELLLSGYANRNDGKAFNKDAMTSLYSALTGKANAKLSDVDALGTLTAKQINSKTGNDIVVTLDNKQWIVTYLGKTNDANPQTYITLWLASSTSTHKWNTWSDNNTSYDYPSNMYSSSYIRANALNSGNGYVASKGAGNLTKITQSEQHEYAKFTMDSIKGSLTSFISTPSKVAYQETENNNLGGTIGDKNYTLPNEAWGTPDGTLNWHSSGNVSMGALVSKSGYADWKDDYIWLPSLTETGCSSVSGIWQLSYAQRSN